MGSSGFNFRTVLYDTQEGSRYLSKLYGIRFVFVTEGTAGKFTFAALTVTLGAGLAYLGVAAIVADVVCSKFLPNADKYNAMKHEKLPIDEAANEETISIVRTCCKEMKECCTMCWCEMMCCGCFRKMCSKTESEKMSAGIVDTKDDEHEDTVESSKEPTVQERLQISESGMNGAE